ncbi:MAG: ATP-dependent endonuclease [Sulfurovum sp.]
MYIKKIKIKNFRLLKDSTLDMKEDLSLLIGRNNSGKTSFLVIFEKFYNKLSFNYNDFSLSLRDEIKKINDSTDSNKLVIQMILTIEYNKDDNLENLSEFILDLDPNCTSINILFEIAINKEKLIKDIKGLEEAEKDRFLNKYLSKSMDTNIYIFEKDEDLKNSREKLIKKDLSEIKNIINFQIIHAKRNVSSSEEKSEKTKVLSTLTTKYFSEINKQMISMDNELNTKYDEDFDSFMKSAKDFLNIKNLKVKSNLESNELVKNSSHVVYGSEESYLPEHLNGLGYMNILYLLLQIEMLKENFKNENKDINLFFIEEPEAHTHPQMQYVFAQKIKSLLSDTNNLQTIITTHSAHIVSQCDFKDIRFLSNVNDNIVIKNFYTELEKLYIDEDSAKNEKEKSNFKFLTQYLTLNASELFFANKIIFIEGTTEKLLLPYFIKQYDENIKDENKKLSSQNISILEVGANGRAFRHFLEFLGIRTLIITDIDTTKKVTKKDTTSYSATKVNRAKYTSNYTLKYYLDAPDINNTDFNNWMKNLKDNKLQNDDNTIKIAYQVKEKGYHARSFEDAFISVNLENIKKKIDDIDGLQNKPKLEDFSGNQFYELTEKILKKNGKSDFASSLLYLVLTDDELEWKMPLYIKDGLKWIAK